MGPQKSKTKCLQLVDFRAFFKSILPNITIIVISTFKIASQKASLIDGMYPVDFAAHLSAELSINIIDIKSWQLTEGELVISCEIKTTEKDCKKHVEMLRKALEEKDIQWISITPVFE